MTNAGSARAEILSRIRSVTGSNAPSSSAQQAWEAIPRSYRQAGAFDHAACIELFADRLHDYGAGVFRIQAPDIHATIAERLHDRNKRRMLVSPDIDAAWLPNREGFSFVADDALSYSSMDGCDGVLTGCTVAIAGDWNTRALSPG